MFRDNSRERRQNNFAQMGGLALGNQQQWNLPTYQQPILPSQPFQQVPYYRSNSNRDYNNNNFYNNMNLPYENAFTQKVNNTQYQNPLRNNQFTQFQTNTYYDKPMQFNPISQQQPYSNNYNNIPKPQRFTNDIYEQSRAQTFQPQINQYQPYNQPQSYKDQYQQDNQLNPFANDPPRARKPQNQRQENFYDDPFANDLPRARKPQNSNFDINPFANDPPRIQNQQPQNFNDNFANAQPKVHRQQPPRPPKQETPYQNDQQVNDQPRIKWSQKKINNQDEEENIQLAQRHLKLLKQKMSEKNQNQTYRKQFSIDSPNEGQTSHIRKQKTFEDQQYNDQNHEMMNPEQRNQFFDNLNSNQTTKKLNKKQQQRQHSPVDNNEAPAYSMGVKNLPVAEYDEDFNQADLQVCPEGCGRKFTAEVLDKHALVCRQVFQQKRKQFDARKKRIVNEESQATLEIQKPRQKDQKQTKKNKWKAQSEAFRAMIKQTKGIEITEEQKNYLKEAEETGKVKCEFCNRQFNETVAKRHIPFCQEKAKQKEFQQRGPPPAKQKVK